MSLGRWLAALFLSPSEYELEVMRADLAQERARLDAANRLILEQAEMILERDNTILTLKAQRRRELLMAQDNEQNTMAGNVVGGAGNAVETVARQVEGAAVEATEFASDNVLGRLLGYVRAAKQIAEGGLQGALDVEKATTDALLKELEELNHTAKQAVQDAGQH